MIIPTLSLQEDSGIECLQTIAMVMRDSDVSPFEVIHSGLIKGLLQNLTSQSGVLDRDLRLRQFNHVFLSCPVSMEPVSTILFLVL